MPFLQVIQSIMVRCFCAYTIVFLPMLMLPCFVQSQPNQATTKILVADTSRLSKSMSKELDEVVVTGTMKEVKRIESPVPVEVYSAAFLKKNPAFHVFEGLLHVNGVRPQNNCNICNTGEIKINGLPGAYTMVLIDGMPIVSALSTVYGLSGIPASMIERIEIVKGPASSLYGSEAIGGLINIITKKVSDKQSIGIDFMTTTWGETNTDLAFTNKVGNKANVLTGINYFNYANPIDQNKDGFTDLSLQQRISIFQKWAFQQKHDRQFNLAARYLYEDRWGGQMNWNKTYRGTDAVYGESIYTNRLELMGNYQLPVKEKMNLAFSLNHHHQNSMYGNTLYMGKQQVAFAQITWDKKIRNHDWLFGAASRYTYYNDNTPGTGALHPGSWGLQPQKVVLPGLFVQDEITLNEQHKILLGLRYDYHSTHGNIVTPRLAYKYTINPQQFLRLNMGTGFRVVNLFTEDHAALSGARKVVIAEQLKPEKSFNINLNYIHKLYGRNNNATTLDVSAFYTYFNNRIVGDFETDPNQIIYNNLQGHAISKGVSVGADIALQNRLKLNLGATYMDVALYQNGQKEQQILTERFSGTWTLSYKFPAIHLDVDYTGNLYSPMRLPLLGPLDPRQPYSPWYSLQNIQFSFHYWKGMELYGGIKNLLNFLPTRYSPFLIARAQDPFDKKVQFQPNGQVQATPDNPYALSFDPTYMFAPNQGVRGFLGIRYTLK